MNFVIFKGKLYLSESTLTTSNQAVLNARKIVNSIMSNKDYNSNSSKEELRLLNYTLANFDLWNIIIEYFSNFAHTKGSKEALSNIRKAQNNIAYDVDKIGNIIAIEYSKAKIKLGNKSAQIQTSYNASNNDTYRKVTYTYRLFLYMVAFYNLKYIEYLNTKVASGELFNKKFSVDLEQTYDPPRMEYINTFFLSPKSMSDFNNNHINMEAWIAELEDKTSVIASGFYNASNWNFKKMQTMYSQGIQDIDKNGNIVLDIPFSENEKAAPYIKNVNTSVFGIITLIRNNIKELKPNLIKNAIKTSEITSTDAAYTKKEIGKNLAPINRPYETTSDYNEQIKSAMPSDKARKTVKQVNEIEKKEKSIKGRIKKNLSKVFKANK
jgi:uncharacterized protein YuzE